MAGVKSGCVLLSFFILAAASSSYGQTEKEKTHKTSHFAARTLPKPFFPTKFGHSLAKPSRLTSMKHPSVSISHHHNIPVSASKLALKFRCAKLSALLESKPSPYPQKSGNPIVPYFPFFPLPPPPSLLLPKPNQPPKHHIPRNPPSTRNPPVGCSPKKPPKGKDNPKVPYFPFCFLAPPPPQRQPPKHHKPHSPPISGNPTIPYYPFFTQPPPPPHPH